MAAPRRTNRTARSAELNERPNLAPVPDAPEPQPEPEPKPDVTVEAVPVTYYRPTVKFPDGRVVVCEHKYLHENEKAGATCGRKIAALGKFVK
jgi:hypothetical protein